MAKILISYRTIFLFVILAITVTTIIIVALYISTNTVTEHQDPYEIEVRKVELSYKGDLVYSTDPTLASAINIINIAHDCNTLKILFTENTGWTARPMLAHKIIVNCFGTK